jgi:peptide/nickel transport system permease protein
MIVILGIAGWVVHARVIRAQVLAQRRMEYVEAARTIGVGAPLILVRHVLPNVLAPTIVITSFSVATFIITASSLSFLGLGLPPSTPDWGLMIADAVKYIRIAWWPSTFAGIALSLTVFGVNVLGDWLRDYLDPRLRLG